MSILPLQSVGKRTPHPPTPPLSGPCTSARQSRRRQTFSVDRDDQPPRQAQQSTRTRTHVRPLVEHVVEASACFSDPRGLRRLATKNLYITYFWCEHLLHHTRAKRLPMSFTAKIRSRSCFRYFLKRIPQKNAHVQRDSFSRGSFLVFSAG